MVAPSHALVVVFPQSPRPLWGCYGSFADLTPNLDQFAAEGIVLDRCIHASSKPDGEIGESWEKIAIETLFMNSGHSVAVIEIPRDLYPALKDLEEFQDELLDRILEAGDARPNPEKKSSLTIVRVPDVPLDLLPETEDEFDETEEDPIGLELEEEDPDDDDVPPSGFPHHLLSIERQIEFERILSWQDQFLPHVISEWENAVGDTSRLVVITSNAGCVFPFEENEDAAGTLELNYRIPCLIRRSGGDFAGMRIQDLVSTGDLPAVVLDWFVPLPQVPAEFNSQSDGNLPTCWSLLRRDVETLHERLYRRAAGGELLVWYPDSFLVLADPPAIYLKPEDPSDLANVALEQPLRTERMLAELQRFTF